jgi:hypothetical protein
MCFTANMPSWTGTRRKASFKFSEIDHGLFRELVELARAGWEGYRAMKFV